jgi:hypothetical protein
MTMQGWLIECLTPLEEATGVPAPRRGVAEIKLKTAEPSPVCRSAPSHATPICCSSAAVKLG